jgi:hypothetical protein
MSEKGITDQSDMFTLRSIIYYDWSTAFLDAHPEADHPTLNDAMVIRDMKAILGLK